MTPISIPVSPYDLMAVHASHSAYAPLDLSAAALAKEGVDPASNEQLSQYIFDGRLRYGGYGERRSVYSRSPHFGSTADESSAERVRDIHLGLDVWAETGTPVRALWAGEVVTSFDNQGLGDYGPTLILRHEHLGECWHSLYGHLSRESLHAMPVGTLLSQGQIIAHLGAEEENGGWPPHVHFQLIIDLEEGATDHPGVCSADDWEAYSANCPDPTPFLRASE